MTTMKHTGTHDFTGATVTGIAGGGGASVTIDADGTLVVDGTTVEVATDAQLAAGLATKLDASAAVPLAQSGQTPSQAPVGLGTGAVGSLAQAARADHVHPAAGEHAWFGNGSDGDIALDGTNTYSTLMSKSGNVYTLTQPLYARNLTISSGVTLHVSGYPVYVSGTLTNGGTVSAIGGNASGATGGTAAPFSSGSLLNIAGVGTSGTTGVGAQGGQPRTAANYNPNGAQSFGGLSGAGGSGTSGAGGAQSNNDYQHNQSNSQDRYISQPHAALTGMLMSAYAAGTVYALFGAPGGASGAGDGTNSGGGGGGGGGAMLINARAVVNNGAVTANGGNGGTPPTGNCGGGGGGGGGPILLNTAATVTGSGSVTNAGGSAGAGVGTGAAGAAGQQGCQQIIVWP